MITAVCLNSPVPSTGLLESYLKVHSHARDHSCTQTKFHVDPYRDSQDYPMTKMQTDRQGYLPFSAGMGVSHMITPLALSHT